MAEGSPREGPFITAKKTTFRGAVNSDGSASCPICKRLGRESALKEMVRGRWACDVCNFGFLQEGVGLVEQLVYDTTQRAETLAAILSPPNIEGLNPEQEELLKDAWANFATGRNNAGLMILGGLVESALREVIEVTHNVSIKGGLRDLTLYCRDNKLVDESYLKFADELREAVRNLWQHQLVEQITAGSTVPVVKMNVPRLDKTEGLQEFMTQVEAAKDKFAKGDVEQLDPLTSRFLQYPRKQQIEAALGPYLYNQVWEWLHFLNSRHLLPRHYEERRKKFGDAGVTFKRKKEEKGKPRVWEAYTPPALPPFENRPMPRFEPGPKA